MLRDGNDDLIAAEIEQGDLSDEIEAMIEKRQRARKARDFKTADALRDRLRDMGFAIEDTPQGSKLRAL